MTEATHLRLALAQIDPVVGDIDGNVRLISQALDQAREQGAQLVLFPELCVTVPMSPARSPIRMLLLVVCGEVTLSVTVPRR